MEQGKGTERRASQRFAMDFKISIYDHENGRRFLEDSVLHDVSGVGISFLSRSPQLYQTGQRLHICIVLPGTDTLEARLEGDASVVRVDVHAESTASIGLAMDDPLDFVAGMYQIPREPGQGV